MATLALVMVPLTVATLMLQIAVQPERFWSAMAVVPATALLFLTYIFARSPRYRWATWVTLFAATAVSVRSITEVPEDVVVFGYFAMPVVLASAALKMRVAAAVAAVNLGIAASMAVFYSDVMGVHGFSAVIMLVVLFVMILLGAQHRRGVEWDKRTELEAKEQRSNAILGAAFGGMAVLRFEEIIECNDGFAALFGYAPHEVIGRQVDELFAGSPQDGPLLGERDAQHRGGLIFPVTVVSRPYETSDGSYRVLAVQDLRDRRELQARLHQTDRMATMGQLAAGVAHEINNPLAWVVGNLALLEGSELDDKSTMLVQKAKDGARRVERIVKDLQTFSRVREPQPQGVDLWRSAHSAANMVRHRLRDRGQVIEDYGAVPTVDADETRVGQICLNLLVNALEALDPSERTRNHVYLRLFTDSHGNAVLEVADNGKGMSPTVERRIFDPFYTTKEQGTGLGLSITRSITEDLGGRLEVESTPGLGTTMRVVLPPGMLSSPSTATPIYAPGRDLAPANILVVDDEPDICDLIQAALSNHRVVTATSVDKAMAALEGESFSAVVCDLMMPVKTGMDLHAEAIARHPELEGHFVFVTGGAYTAKARAFLDETRAPVLEKPFRLDHIRELVEDLIPTTKRSASVP